jgi:hypothetical protein
MKKSNLELIKKGEETNLLSSNYFSDDRLTNEEALAVKGGATCARGYKIGVRCGCGYKDTAAIQEL